MPTERNKHRAGRKAKPVPKRPPTRAPRSNRTKVEPVQAERVLALDISSVAVGWSLFDGGEPSAHGKYLHEGAGHGERLHRFEHWLADMLREAEPDHLIIEKPFPGHNRNAYRVLTLYIGAVYRTHYRCWERELPDTHELPPQTVKRYLRFPKGRNHADNKRIAVEAINARYGLALVCNPNDRSKKTSDDDIADAIALNRAWHLHTQRLTDAD